MRMPDGTTHPLSKEKASQYDRVFDWVLDNFIHTKMMLPDSTVYQKHHGIPSGSFLTSLLGSICNAIAITYISKLCGIEVEDLKVLGDDSSLQIHTQDLSKVDFHLFAKLAKFVFGMILSPTKCSVTEPGEPDTFLGYHFDGVKLTRPTDELLKMMLYPERSVTDPTISCSRGMAFWILGACNDAIASNIFLEFFAHIGIQPAGKLIHSDSQRWFVDQMRYDFGKGFKLEDAWYASLFLV